MRVLMTGHDGYIGAVLAPFLSAEGHDVVGLDTRYYRDCGFGDDAPRVPVIDRDLRDIRGDDLAGFDAIIHLAALSNDPVGDLNPNCTYDINHHASLRLARLAKEAGVQRFLFSSSCSVYGASSPDDILDEHATFAPITPYAESKVAVEHDLLELADDAFSPTFLRNATVYGVSPRLRGDVVVNNLVGWAVTTGKVFLKSDGSPWRPLVHVEDVCRAFSSIMVAPREAVHAEAFNVGRQGENYRIRTVAELVQRAVPGSELGFAEGAGADPRCYRVDFSKIARMVPSFQPTWNVERGIDQLRDAYEEIGLTRNDLEGPRFSRVKSILRLLEEGRLDSDLRWKAA